MACTGDAVVGSGWRSSMGVAVPARRLCVGGRRYVHKSCLDSVFRWSCWSMDDVLEGRCRCSSFGDVSGFSGICSHGEPCRVFCVAVGRACGVQRVRWCGTTLRGAVVRSERDPRRCTGWCALGLACLARACMGADLPQVLGCSESARRGVRGAIRAHLDRLLLG